MKFTVFLYLALKSDIIFTCGPHVAVWQNPGVEKVSRIGLEFSTDSLIVKVYRAKSGSISEVISFKFGGENLVLLLLLGAGSPILGVLLSVVTMKVVLRVILFGFIVVVMFQGPEISKYG